MRPHTTCTRPDLVQPVRGGWSPTNFKVGQPDQVRHKGLWVQSFWKRDSYQLDLAQISKCWTLKSKGAIDESRNLHLNSPPRLGLCIFLKILKNSVGSWIQWPLFNLSVRQVYTVHMLSCDWNHYSLFAYVRAYSHFCTRTGYKQPSCISDILSYQVLHFGPWTPFTETKDAVPPNLRG